jgi:pullulanase-type alpha-1,6-glucosidase
VHWGVPDGSYCTSPDGAGRTLQFRAAVSSLNALGLRVVVDVVYNHVYGSGPASQHAVLDKLVPGYYLRRDASGAVEASTCMNNTASEHAMCERLIVDDVLHWATTYRVDGFRYDLMGHLMKRVMLRIRARLDALCLADDGVDGRSILLYGEGWDYAEVADGRVGDNASQRRLAGTGVGTFNDRIREGAMGGGPFGDPRLQGLLTGLFTASAPGVAQGTEEEQRAALARATERVLTGVAGNLAAYEFTGADGEPVAGRDAGGRGSWCGYVASPAETVNYCAAHDNETLFDLVALKMHATSDLAARCRVVGLAQALLAWSQGIPFFHAGDEVLRSKSLDRDSYNSGDWFNALDWSGARTGWGVGLPPAGKNAQHWPLMRLLLSDPTAAPSVAHVAAAAAHFRQSLRVRASSPLFRLRTAADVQARLHMHNRGPDERPGVLVWELRDGGDDPGLPTLDERFARLLVALNATQQPVALPLPALASHAWRLHPVLAASEDAAVRAAEFACGELRLPPLTAVVFVVAR